MIGSAFLQVRQKEAGVHAQPDDRVRGLGQRQGHAVGAEPGHLRGERGGGAQAVVAVGEEGAGGGGQALCSQI